MQLLIHYYQTSLHPCPPILDDAGARTDPEERLSGPTRRLPEALMHLDDGTDTLASSLDSRASVA